MKESVSYEVVCNHKTWYVACSPECAEMVKADCIKRFGDKAVVEIFVVTTSAYEPASDNDK